MYLYNQTPYFHERSSCMWLAIRKFALKHYLATTVIWALLFVGLGNFALKAFLEVRGGILDDALPMGDSIRDMADEARAEKNFNAAEAAFIILKLPPGDPGGIKRVEEFSKKLKDLRRTVISLSTVKRYQVTEDEEVSGISYLSPKLAPGNDTWKKLVESDPSVFQVLVGPDWSWTALGVVLDPGYQEIPEAWKITAFVEGHEGPYSLWDRLFKADIKPAFAEMSVTGWVMIRWMIDQCLNRDMIFLPTIGIFIALVIFTYALQSFRQASLATLVCVAGVIQFQLALVYLIHAFVPTFSLRVYSLLALANIIVQGTSFGLHKFGAFREIKAETSQERFVRTLHVDRTIALIGIIGVIAFLLLRTYQVWQLEELGYQAAMGVVLAYVSATVFLPCVYLTLEHFWKPERKISFKEIQFAWYGRFDWMLPSPKTACWVILGSVAIIVIVFGYGFVRVGTKPVEYVEHTEVGKTFHFLRDRKSATDIFPFLVRQTTTQSKPFWSDMPFLHDAWDFEKSLRDGRFSMWQKEHHISPVELFGVSSILVKVSEISQAEIGTEMPENADQAADIFEIMLPDSIERDLRQWLWSTRVIRLNLGVNGNASQELRAILDSILPYAAERYPNLRVTPFGKIATFPNIDGYIGSGVAQNFVMSFLLVAVIAGIWLKIRYQLSMLKTVLSGVVLASPFVIGTAAIALLMLILGMDLSMSTVPIADLAVSAGNDFSIYMAASFFSYLAMGMEREEARHRAVHHTGSLVFTDCVLNACAFLPLLFSQFEPVRELGGLMVAMLFVCYYGSGFIVPSLLTQVMKDSLLHQQPLEVDHVHQEAFGGGGGSDRNARSNTSVR